MAGRLSDSDHATIRALREADVLQDASGHLLDQSNGVIFVGCSDGDRFYDIFRHQVDMQLVHRADPRIHVLAWHGGALACAPCSPINRRKKADEVFLDQIADARSLKGINLVALHAHAPCGAAALHGVPLERVFALHVRAKLRVKTLNQGVKVACFFHVDYGGGVKRTYFFSRDRWVAWAEKHSLQAIA